MNWASNRTVTTAIMLKELIPATAFINLSRLRRSYLKSSFVSSISSIIPNTEKSRLSCPSILLLYHRNNLGSRFKLSTSLADA